MPILYLTILLVYKPLQVATPSFGFGFQDLKSLIDAFHDNNVIFDWVPSHFPEDAHGLVFYGSTYMNTQTEKKDITLTEKLDF